VTSSPVSPSPRLDNVVDALDLERLADALVEGLDLLALHQRIEREHGREVTHLLEGGAQAAAHAQRRRIGRAEVRVLFLERLELAEELVILRVRDGRLVEHVVAVVVLADRGGQLRDALLRLGARHARRLAAPPSRAQRARGRGKA
jgi:hypothetical protein